jgi:aspartyl-tRNA(Asn)/glutamyl-tRNA(Gln) amidotransferase subunit A
VNGASASISSVQQTEDAFSRIAQVDGDIRAIVATFPNSARAEAKASDARRAKRMSKGPLDGMPFAVKDNIAVAGLPTHAGTMAFEEPAPADATVVARLRAAGAVLIGTLNMHEGALGATTDNPFWGRCMNPLKPGYTPGGSSGGSAAAVAGGMLQFTLGTDTLGSVRVPAAYCGLWGLKPTKGGVPTTGLTHLSWTLDTIGPLARDPSSLGAILSAIEGSDEIDRLSGPMCADGPIPQTLLGLRFGVPDAAALAECETVVLQAVEALKSALTEKGAVLTPITVTGWGPGALRRAGLLISEVEGAEVLGDALDGPGLSDSFRAMLDYGRRAGAGRLAQAYRQVQELSVSFDHAIEGLDGLLLPTTPQRAFAHDGTVPVNQADFTALANVAGAPALTIPMTARDGNLPCAAQIVGPRGSDHRLVAIGKLIQDLHPVWRAG